MVSEISRLLAEEYRNLFTIISVIAILGALWLVWRGWRFTLAPYLWPKNPIMLPYSIPFIGHTFRFLWDPEGTLRRGDAQFKGDGPYALLVGGFRFVIIRNPQDVQSVWKNTKSLSFDAFIQTAFNGIGIPGKSYHPMFQPNPAQFFHGTEEEKPHFVSNNPANKRYINFQEDWKREPLSPGKRMDTVTGLFLGYIDEALRFSPRSPEIAIASDQGCQTVSLYNWYRFTLVEAEMKAFLGKEIFNFDPDFVKNYIEWEKSSWKVAHQRPGFLLRDMRKAREGSVQTITKYYAAPATQRPNLSWLFNRMQSEQQKLGLQRHEAAAISLIMLWGVHLNTFRLLFWALTHILSDPTLTRAIREETSPARLMNGKLSIPYSFEKCPQLNAVLLEALRLYNSAAVIRAAEATTEVGDKTIYPGDRVLGPFRLMHLSTRIFGSDASNFDHKRWIKDKKLLNVKGFYPFGGGHTYCPGRIIAKQEVLMFVSTVLEKFDMVPAEASDEKGMWKVPGIGKGPALTMLDPDEDF